LPSVNLKYNKEYLGLNILITAWANTFENINFENINSKTNKYTFMLNDNLQYNYHFFVELFSILASNEESYFINTRKFKKKNKKVDATTFEEEIEMWENLQFHIPDILQLGNNHVPFQTAKDNFYKYYNIDKNVTICEYLKGLCWNSQYYFNNCPDYLWYYPYMKSPFVTDIYEWLLENVDKFQDIMNYYNKPKNNGNCVFPLEQLTLVLPPQSSYLLPKTYRSVVLENENIFPQKFEVDFQDINKMYLAHPKVKLPLIIDIKLLLFDKTLTEDEQKRNKFRNIYKIII
jgi:5'-3' exonuclease